ncbi:MAG: hypothetical protein LBE35_10050 [Clostridiales bacterium]|jgi:hypothetical protein|nr:hypothetical protein [Clostridiales bacterium]
MKTFCVYCKVVVEKDEGTKPITVGAYKAVCCGEECFTNAANYVDFSRRRKILYGLGLAVSAILLFVSIFFFGMTETLGVAFFTIGWMLLGVATFMFPFVMPQTIEMMGIRKGMRLSRLVGIITILATPVWLLFLL